MKILLTGPTGFIGGNFLRQALARGHQVAALVFPGEQIAADLARQANLKLITGALAAPPWEEIAAFEPECCLHCAWITTPGRYLEAPENDQFLAWSCGLAEAFFQRGGQYFFGLGSCAEYRPARRPLAEDDSPLNDSTRYARCKNALRLRLAELARQHQRGYGWGRVFYPFGTGEHADRLCSALIRRIARGEPVELKTPESTKDYIQIEDLALAMLTVIERRPEGVVNLGTGRGITVREIARQIGDLCGRPELVREAAVVTADPLDFMVADAARLRGLGWRETVGFAEGLRRLREHLCAHPSNSAT